MRASFNLGKTISAIPVAIAFLTVAIVSVFFIGFSTTTSVSATPNAAVVSVNAASFAQMLSPGAIAAAFGSNLATRTESAQSVPLPTNLAGTTVRIIDSRNVEHAASLFFVSSGQINYLIPDNAALGAAQIVITSGSGEVSRGTLQLVNSAPAIFTTSYTGRGLPVALTTYDGVVYDSVTNADGSAKAVSAGSSWRPNYLLLFGTGMRSVTGLRVRIGNTEITPLYAGAQGSFAGLDQVNLMLPSNMSGGIAEITLVSDSRISNTVQLRMAGEAAPAQNSLTVADVQQIISQAVGRAQQIGLPVTVAVLDKEANVLGVFKMNGARSDIKIGATNLQNGAPGKPADPDGLNELVIPLRNPDGTFVAPPGPLRDGAALAAISKAGTAAFFSTQGNAFTTRTASFIIQEHFPPLARNTPGGPLFGVQFSQLPCSDVKTPNLPLGLSGDPGSTPIYKNGVAAGGVGIEGDGLYSVDLNASDQDQSPEEIIAVAATLGFEPPAAIRGDQILVDGNRLPYVNAPQTGGTAPAFGSLPGTVLAAFPIRAAAASMFTPLTLGGIPGRVDPRFFPFKNGALNGGQQLTAADVNRIITQAAQQAYRTRAAIRIPTGSPAEVNIAVTDLTGTVIGLFSTQDAPIFGFDVSAQKARTAAFFSKATAGAELRAAEAGRFAKFADAAAVDGIRLDGSIAFSDRANGFLSRPFFPDGIDGTQNGPFSKPINLWSPFNTGLQIALVRSSLVRILSGLPVTSCTAIPSLPHGIQIFAGSVPLFKNGILVGAIGISGDGIDQDDIIAATGSVGFETPAAIRADQFLVRGVRLPWVKFPRHPNL
ncbi:MAG: heme-binding protein [Acidobacteriota bacterium]|nr:heme-binding protein [Acidobacteriota bacterium]